MIKNYVIIIKLWSYKVNIIGNIIIWHNIGNKTLPNSLQILTQPKFTFQINYKINK